jgi:two-component system, sensor histidine kinase RegB
MMTGAASLAVLRQLCALRWIAVLGQAATVVLVIRLLGIPLPWTPLAAGIGVLTAFNLYASWHGHRTRQASDLEVALHIGADIAVLTWQVAWSGGMENPFASLFLLPIAIAILALPAGLMVAVALLSVAGYLICTLYGPALPDSPQLAEGIFELHQLGMLANFALSAAVILLVLTRLAQALRRSEQQLAKLREQFARDEGIVALATHAASVAHEMNTPLATMTLLVDDMEETAQTPAQREEFATLRTLLGICRDRVRALAVPAGSPAVQGALPRVSLETVIQQWQLVRPTVQLHRSGSMAGLTQVDTAVGHLLQALLNNAADASEQAGVPRVDLHLESHAGGLKGEIRDYGPGFENTAPPLPAALFRSSKPDGLGIGLALSHATVERLGGELSMQAAASQGVRVAFNLPACAA